nr:unnamed protein product [Callosobruchus chinensis]
MQCREGQSDSSVTRP